MSDEEAKGLSQRLRPLIGRAAWGVAVGHGSFLTLELGSVMPQRFGGTKQHGEWHLWLYMTGWRIEVRRGLIASSDDPRPQMEQGAKALDGQIVTAVEVAAPSGDLTIRFGDASLRTFVVEADAEQWRLYTPTGTVLEVGPGETWTEAPGQTTR